MTFKNKTIQKIFSTLIIVLILVPTILLSQPKKASAFTWSTFFTDIFVGTSVAPSSHVTAVNSVTQTGFKIKDVAQEVLRQITMTIERRLLQKITQSTINWINTGFHGNPLYIENPGSFFKDIAKTEIKTIIDTYGYNQLLYPFGKDFALNTINSYNRQADENLRYSLSKVFTDPVLLNNYRNNFNVGGWNGFLINTQYPQNNYLGFNMLATEKLALKLRGTVQTKAQQVQTKLQQGMGFLSPQTCPSNPNYPPATNPYDPPTFKNTLWDPPKPEYTSDGSVNWTGNRTETPESIDRYNLYRSNWEQTNKVNKDNFNTKYSCPKGLVDTTPGTVVASQITNAMGSQFRQSELAAAMGNSISAVLDALLNHFMGEGLNKLASKVNPPPDNPDNWDYYGNKLGSPSDSSGAYGSGPDQELILDAFRKKVEGHTDRVATKGETIKDLHGNDVTAEGGEIISEIGETGNGTYVPGDMANTKKELTLIDNYTNPSDPGIIQMFGAIWPKTKDLDACLPGPDRGWQDRLQQELEKNSKILQEKINEDDAEKSVVADLAFKELKFAVDFFKEWINNKLMTELPKSVIFMDAVDKLDTYYQQSDELIAAKRLKTQALARLGAVQQGLASLGDTQPDPGSDGEKILINWKKQYDATRDSIGNISTVATRQSELNTAKDDYKKLNELIPECQQERLDKGWTNPGGRSSTYKDKGTEQNLFCDFPIKGGTPHQSFQYPTTLKYPEIPLVNAKDVLTWTGIFWISHSANVQLNCNIIYKASDLDYKKNLPGLATVAHDLYEANPYIPSGGGECIQPPTDAQKANAQKAADYMLGILNDPANTLSVQDVVDKTNAQYPGGEAGEPTIAAYYSDSMIASHEFYLAGPTADRPTSPATGKPWDVNWRGVCTDTGGGNYPVPDPTKAPADVGSMCAAIASAASAMGVNSDDDQLKVLTKVASDFAGAGWGLYKKTNGGYSCGPNKTSCDIMYDGKSCYLYDVFTSAHVPYCRLDDFISNRGEHWYSPVGASYPSTACTGSTVPGSGTTPSNPYPTPATNPNIPADGPVITSVSPAVIKPGITTITIGGTNLSTINKTTTTTVQFFWGPSGKLSVDGAVNSAKTQVTILVPAEINTTTAAIKIYRDGTIQSAPYTIQISGTGGTTTSSGAGTDASPGWNGSLAYNTTAQNWLVVSQGSIDGRIMSSGGKPVGDVFKINPDSQDGLGGPLVEYSPDANKFLVVWRSFANPSGDSDIYARFVSSDKTMGSPFKLNIPSAQLTIGAGRMSALRYDSKNKKFVLITDSGANAIVTTIDLKGNRGGVATITGNADGDATIYAPSIAVNPDKNEYCAVFDYRSSGTGKWGTAVINASNLTVGTKSVVSSVSGNQDIAYNTQTKKYFVVYDGYDNKGVKGKILNSCSGTDGGTVFTIKGNIGRARLSYNSKSNTYGVIGQNGADSGNGYVILSGTGSILKTGTVFTVSTKSSDGNYSPAISANVSDGSFGVTSSWLYLMTRFIPRLCGGTCSGTTPPTPPTPPTPVPVPAPVIDSLSTSIAKIGDTVTITGTNLTGNVLFNYANDTAYKSYTTGIVNSDKTKTVIVVPSDIQADNYYLVKVKTSSSPVITSNGKQLAVTPAPAVTVTAPNGGEKIVQGSNFTIKWKRNFTPTGQNGIVEIAYRKGTAAKVVIAPSATDTLLGFVWSVPSNLTTGSDYKIVITTQGTSSTQGPLFDDSDAAFTVSAP